MGSVGLKKGRGALLAAMAMAGASAGFGLGSAEAALVALSTNSVGGLLYTGLGDIQSGVGSGRYQVGACEFDGANSVCTLTGSYTQTATSTDNPGATGSFLFEQIWPGSGTNPVVARSRTAGSNDLFLATVGAGFFRLTLTPSSGPQISGIFPATPFSDSIGFSLFLTAQAVCTGLAPGVACSVANVGRTPGSTISGAIGEAFFTIPDALIPVDPNPVPVPGAIALFATGAAAFAAAKRKRKA